MLTLFFLFLIVFSWMKLCILEGEKHLNTFLSVFYLFTSTYSTYSSNSISISSTVCYSNESYFYTSNPFISIVYCLYKLSSSEYRLLDFSIEGCSFSELIMLFSPFYYDNGGELIFATIETSLPTISSLQTPMLNYRFAFSFSLISSYFILTCSINSSDGLFNTITAGFIP
jgi:hypothetical protein